MSVQALKTAESVVVILLTSQRATRFDPSVIGGDALFLRASAVIFVLLFPSFLHSYESINSH